VPKDLSREKARIARRHTCVKAKTFSTRQTTNGKVKRGKNLNKVSQQWKQKSDRKRGKKCKQPEESYCLQQWALFFLHH
jgi:hypothetical protein